MNYNLTPIGVIKTDYKEKFGTPRQSLRVKSATGKIVMDEKFSDINAFRGIEEFSHLWLVFDFSLSHTDDFSPTVRPPRLGGNKRVGVFASRAPFRPNNLGLSVVELKSVEFVDGKIILTVKGADIVDGTPIFDIKPYVPYSDCVLNAKGSYAEENKGHKLSVVFPDNLKEKFDKEKIETLTEVLSEDPRPGYADDGEKVFTFNFAGYEVSFCVNDKVLLVTNIKKNK